ncbi:MAG TPA: hypothetical protein VGR31_03665 [Planctomycetota bacterium]|jgi:hypothetical protein|nr:hypothetical protein [Planctomycetota bacterium]
MSAVFLKRSSSAVLASLALCVVASAQQSQQAKIPHPPALPSQAKPTAPPVVKTPRPETPGAITKTAPPARATAPTKLPAGLAPHARPDRERVDVSEPGDGRIWARGADWKASFGEEGATYVPFLGSCAATSHPIAFSIDAITAGGEPVRFDGHAAATHSAQRVEFDRGGVVEVYDLAARSVEQSFVFSELPAAGDLVVRMNVTTDLSVAGAADGVRFSNELGSVTYTGATVVDAHGRSAALAASSNGTSLELVVPGAFLASAAYPVVIDPVISTFPVDTTSPSDYSPDTAYDFGFNRYLVVEEETFSGTDHDVYATLLDSTGGFVNAGYVDSSGDYWALPKVANNNIANQFLVVAEVSPSGSGPWNIRGRTVDAGALAMSGQFTISVGETGDKILPSVGGDPNPNPPTYYCVAWTRIFASGDDDIHYQLVDSSGGLLFGSTHYIDDSAATLDYSPSVSKSDGTEPFGTQEWNVVWTREFSSTDHDIYGAQIHWDGGITTPSFGLDTSTADDYFAVASSPHDAASGTRNWMVAFNELVGGDWDVLAWALNGGSTFAFATLSGLESDAGSGTYFENQLYPQTDCDGSKFAITYAESYLGSATDYDMYIATFSLVGINFRIAEGHQNLDFSSDGSFDSGVTSRHSGNANPGRFMAAWDLFVGGSGDVYGGLYDAPLFQPFCFPGFDASACPCGNPPSGIGRGCNNSSNTGGAVLYATGVPRNDSVVLHGYDMRPTTTGFCIFFQGANLAQNGIIFGDGRRCTAIPLKRLYIEHVPGGAANAPTGSEQSILTRSAALGDSISPGMTRWYQIQYRDPLNYACGGVATFNATNALQIDW